MTSESRTITRPLITVLLLLVFVPPAGASKTITMSATAFALHGSTTTGVRAKGGVVAADPRILPLGTLIQVTGAGQYSGTYVVADTGSHVRGRQIDIHVASPAEARRFGRRKVRVRVLRLPR